MRIPPRLPVRIIRLGAFLLVLPVRIIRLGAFLLVMGAWVVRRAELPAPWVAPPPLFAGLPLAGGAAARLVAGLRRGEV